MKLKKVFLSLFLLMNVPVASIQLKASELVSDDQLADHQIAAPAIWGAVPSKLQYEYHKQELAAFLHFGMNTYTGKEWGHGDERPSQFALNETFDADNIVRNIKEAGFKRLIVTAKHHDGFALWRSQYTDHDLEATNYPGDILEEISTAATKYDLDMGLYLSPWDAHDPSYGYFDADRRPLVGNNGQPLNGMTWQQVEEKDVLDYNDYYVNQLTEILGNDKYGNHGRFVEVWMDGAKGGGANAQNYDFDRYFATVQQFEGGDPNTKDDDCLIFQIQDHTTVRWIGNEHGFAAEETWGGVRVNHETKEYDDNLRNGYSYGYEDGNQWAVPEADARITSGWFWGPNKATPKSMEQLAEMYFRSVGHGAPLLLNFPPNTSGKLDDAITNRMLEFGNAIKKSFETNYILTEGVSAKASEVRGNDIAYKPSNVLDNNEDTYWTVNDGTNQATLEIDLGQDRRFDLVTLEEAIKFGQRIKNYRVEYQLDNGPWTLLEESKTIGAKRIIRSNLKKADKLRITVTTTQAPPMLTRVGVYKSVADFEKQSPLPDGLVNINIDDKDTSDGFGFAYNNWNPEHGDQYVNGNNMWTTNSELTVNFNGSKVYLIGTKDPRHGTMKIYIDDVGPISVDTSNSKRKTGQLLFESEDLTDGPHRLRLVANQGAIGIEAALALNNGGKGMLEFEKRDYTMYEDSEQDVVILRKGGSNGEISVLVQDNPGSAVQGDYYTTEGLRVDFADGETSKTIQIRTKRDSRVKGDINFTVDLVEPTNNAILGFIEQARFTIKDLDGFSREQLSQLVASVENLDEHIYVTAPFVEMKKARAIAKEVLAENREASYGDAYVRLEKAIAKLRQIDVYSEAEPFYFPEKINDVTTIEAEFAIQDNQGVNERWPLVILKDSWASNNKFVDSFNNGDKLYIPYVAALPGTYKMKVYYQSGSASNSFSFSEENNKLVGKEVSAGANAVGTTHVAETEFEVTTKGAGKLILTAGSSNAPRIDKIEIILLATQAEIVDVDALNQLINQVEEINTAKYTNETVSSLNDILVEAKNLVKDVDKTQDQVNQMVERLTTAKNSLVLKPVVKTNELEEKINSAKSLEADNYTEESYNNLTAAIAKAEKLLKSNDKTQEEVTAMVTELDNLINNLEEKVEEEPEVVETVDLNPLKELIAQIEAINPNEYSEASYQNLIAAKDSIKEKIETETITNTEATEAIDNLNALIRTLIPITEGAVGGNELNKLVELLEGLDASDYTADSYQSFKAIVDEIKTAIKTNEETDLETIVEMIERLIDAASSLTVDTSVQYQFESLDAMISELETLDFDNVYDVSGRDEINQLIERAKALKLDPISQENIDNMVHLMRNKVSKLAKQLATINTENNFSVELTKEFKTLNNISNFLVTDISTHHSVAEFKNKYKNSDVYEMSLVDGENNPIENFNNFKAKVRIPKKENEILVKMLYIDDNNNEESVPFIVDGNFIEFEVSHFSKYAAVYKEKVIEKVENKEKEEKSTIIGTNSSRIPVIKTEKTEVVGSSKAQVNTAISLDFPISSLLILLNLFI